MGALQADPDSASIADQDLATVTRHLMTELDDPLRYIEIPRFLLLPRIFPQWGRPTGPDSAWITSRRGAWEWIYQQAGGKIDISNWQHMAHVDELHDASAELLNGKSECKYSLYIPPEMAGELAQVQSVAVYRKTERRGWTPDIPANADARMRASCRAVPRNIKNGYAQQHRQLLAPIAQGNQKVTLQDGTVSMPSGGDAIAPEAPAWPESRRPRLRPRKMPVGQDSQKSAPAPNAQTPKRERAAKTKRSF